MFVWIRDKGIAQSDSGKGGTPWTGGIDSGKMPDHRHTYDDENICCVK